MIFTQNTTYFSIISIIIGASLPLVIPLLHFGIVSRLWDQYNFPVDKYNCRNTCWDTIFKGPIETGSEYGSTYKHLYFNCNVTTYKLWVITVIAIIIVYEATKYVVFVVSKGCARIRMVALVLLTIYPHYYSWWMFINYYNDEYFTQYWHQVFFFITEMCSTGFVISSVNKEIPFTQGKLLMIVSIACLHILLSGTDQFVTNIILLRGELHQILRDICLMLPDLFHLVLPIIEYMKQDDSSSIVFFVNGKEKTICKTSKISLNNLIQYCAFICGLWVIGNNL